MAATIVNNYTLGRGRIFFGQFGAGTQLPVGERYMGNTPAFSMSIEPDKLPHYSSDEGIKEKDDSATLQVNRTGSLETDNIDPENLAILFAGDTVISSQAATPVVAEAVIASAVGGLWYQLGTSDTNPTGVRDVSAVAIKDITPTTYTVDVDYILDAALGRFQVVKGSSLEGVAILADYTPAAVSRERVISKGTTIEGSLRFIAYNPKGKDFDYFMPWVELTANGDFSLKGEEWMKIPFSMEILKKTGVEAIYVDGRPYTPA